MNMCYVARKEYIVVVEEKRILIGINMVMVVPQTTADMR